MSRSQHRRPMASCRSRSDRSSRIALTFLAFAGLIGPVWPLRTHIGQFLAATDHPTAVAVPDASGPLLAADR